MKSLQNPSTRSTCRFSCQNPNPQQNLYFTNTTYFYLFYVLILLLTNKFGKKNYFEFVAATKNSNVRRKKNLKFNSRDKSSDLCVSLSIYFYKLNGVVL